MMKVLERRLSKVSLLMIQASAVSKGQFVSRDTLHVSKLEFDCQTCGRKNGLSKSYDDFRAVGLRLHDNLSIEKMFEIQ